MARPRQLLNCSYHNLVSVGHIVVVVVYKQKSVKLESQTFIVIGCHCHSQGLGPYKGKVTGRKAYCCCYCCCCCCCSDCWHSLALMKFNMLKESDLWSWQEALPSSWNSPWRPVCCDRRGRFGIQTLFLFKRNSITSNIHGSDILELERVCVSISQDGSLY